MIWLKKLVPAGGIRAYHFLLAYVGALIYRFPSRKLLVIAVTGTKGKSSVTELINAILEEAGYKTALLNSIRFKIGEKSKRNILRMTTPGRFFIQRFLRRAVDIGCTAAILEMTSEGAAQHRHRAIELDALVFTNLAPEHIERHGSFEAYADAKFEIGKQLVRSRKRPRIFIGNGTDPQTARYMKLPAEMRNTFELSDREHVSGERGGYFMLKGKKYAVHLPGEFSLMNALAAAQLAACLNIPEEAIARGLDQLKKIPGRAETIEEGQSFTVVVDYAHTPDSLLALYDAYAAPRLGSGPKRKLICVLGNTGGGRDTWKRPVMGKIADEHCAEVILTNEDPYDEDPRLIVEEMTKEMSRKPTIIMDRREAIRYALQLAKSNDAVLISGKGTDPCICIAKDKKIPWSDAEIVREELRRLKGTQNSAV